jgi:hypothetical protein
MNTAHYSNVQYSHKSIRFKLHSHDQSLQSEPTQRQLSLFTCLLLLSLTCRVNLFACNEASLALCVAWFSILASQVKSGLQTITQKGELAETCAYSFMCPLAHVLKEDLGLKQG